jgi:FHA domain
MSSDKFCTSCKQKNTPTALHCIYCGVPLEASGPQLNSTSVWIGQAQPELLTNPNHWPRSTFELSLTGLALFELNDSKPFVTFDQPTAILGRTSSDVTQTDLIDLTNRDGVRLGISRQHALITRVEAGYTIEDLRTQNGTWLNEFRLTPGQPYPLASGSLLRLGQLALRAYFRSGQDAEEILLHLADSHLPSAASFILTPSYLKQTLTPFLEALAEVQHLLSGVDAGGSADLQIKDINAITSGSFIGVSVVGAGQAIDAILKWINPWRSVNGPRWADWRNASNADAKSALLNDSLQLELFALANCIVGEVRTSLPEDQKRRNVAALLEPLRELAISRLQIVKVGPN